MRSSALPRPVPPGTVIKPFLSLPGWPHSQKTYLYTPSSANILGSFNTCVEESSHTLLSQSLEVLFPNCSCSIQLQLPIPKDILWMWWPLKPTQAWLCLPASKNMPSQLRLHLTSTSYSSTFLFTVKCMDPDLYCSNKQPLPCLLVTPPRRKTNPVRTELSTISEHTTRQMCNARGKKS